MNWKHYALLGVSLFVAIAPSVITWLQGQGLAPWAIVLQGLLAVVTGKLALNAQPPTRRTPIGVAMMLRMVAMSVLTMFVVFLSACAAFRSAQPTIQTVLTDTQEACMDVELAASVIPPGTPLAQPAADVEAVCGIAQTAGSFVEQVISDIEALAADAGVPSVASGAVYLPSPRARARHSGSSKSARLDVFGHLWSTDSASFDEDGFLRIVPKVSPAIDDQTQPETMIGGAL